MDTFSKKKRSDIMSRIRGKNTSLEKMVFFEIRRKGVRIKKNYAGLPGKPDLVNIAKQAVVFIDSDFWHGWRYPVWENRLPKAYWREKIRGNRLRDKKNNRILKRMGWDVLRVWEHQLKKDYSGTLSRIEKFLY